MPAETKQQVKDLRDTTNADSMSEVIGRALALPTWQEKVNGGTTIFRSKDGIEQRLPADLSVQLIDPAEYAHR